MKPPSHEGGRLDFDDGFDSSCYDDPTYTYDGEDMGDGREYIELDNDEQEREVAGPGVIATTTTMVTRNCPWFGENDEEVERSLYARMMAVM